MPGSWASAMCWVLEKVFFLHRHWTEKKKLNIKQKKAVMDFDIGRSEREKKKFSALFFIITPHANSDTCVNRAKYMLFPTYFPLHKNHFKVRSACEKWIFQLFEGVNKLHVFPHNINEVSLKTKQRVFGNFRVPPSR